MSHRLLAPGSPISALRGLAFWSLLALTALCYWPTLRGPFIFDDVPNLMGLARIESVFGLEFWSYVTYGIAGPGGRPLALLTFALQYAAWPVDPYAFHALNLALHLVTGALCALLVLRLARHWWPADPGRAESLALVATAIWLLHPIQVSTVAYVVQRMTILSALFVVGGLLCWTHGHALVARAPQRTTGYLWAALGTGACGLLAIASKETGVLLLAYAMVLEHTVFRDQPMSEGWRRLRIAVLYAPATLFCLIVAWRWDAWISAKYQIRDFTLAERLLTEPRVLVDYIGLIFVPSPSRLTLFHDDYAVSRGLLEPLSTLAALAFILFLAASAWRLRERAPVVAFAALWFLAGHLLESTFLPLEIYFEHRNYLPLLGPAIAVAFYAQFALARLLTTHARRLVPVLLVAAGLAFATLAHFEAWMWGNPLVMGPIWAAEHPTSERARSYYAGILKKLGHDEAAVLAYEQMAREFPLEAGPYVEWFEMGCWSETIRMPDRAELLGRLRTARFSYIPVAVISRIIGGFEDDGSCGRVLGSDVLAMLQAIDENPVRGDAPELTSLLRARLLRLRGDKLGALRQLDLAMTMLPRLDVALLRVIVAIEANDLAAARRYHGAALALARSAPLQGITARQRLADWDAKLRLVESARRPAALNRQP